MVFSALMMTVLLPAQIAAYSGPEAKYQPFFVVGSFVDCAKILGLPKFRLRDGNGNPYLPDKALLQEPLAQILAAANIVISEAEVSKRKKYIQSYVRK
jgi:hypothetical protein